MLVSRELERAMQGNILGTRTLSLFYTTDFADQLENRIIPALRSGFIVLAIIAFVMVRLPLAHAGRPEDPAPPTAIM